MKSSFFSSLLMATGLLLAAAGPAGAQRRNAPAANGSLPWFTVVNKLMVVQTGATTKVLEKNVTLPNGSRVEFQTQSVVLANGTRVRLKEGDLLSLSGELIQKSPANAIPPAGATASLVPVASPVPAAPAVVPVAVAPAPAPAAPSPVAAAAPAVPIAAPMASAAFTYRPEAPVNGKLKGVVELGASGFNSFIIRVDSKRAWKLERSEYGNSLVMENLATEDDIRKGLKAYIGQMLDFGVSGRDIHFVVSSGALMAQVTGRIIKALNSLHYVVNTVTPEQEGIFSLKSVLPPSYNDKAFVMDIGSGNTKVSWLDHGTPKSLHSYGAKYFERNIDSTTVSNDVKAIARQVPEERRGTCFIIGGVPFDMAKIVRQGKERYTVLRPPTGYTDQRSAKIKAGINIYNAMATTTNCPQFVFDWDANFTIGYLLSLP